MVPKHAASNKNKKKPCAVVFDQLSMKIGLKYLLIRLLEYCPHFLWNLNVG